MVKIMHGLSFLVAGATLYQLGRTLLEQRDQRLLALVARRQGEFQTRSRRLYHLAVACQRGTLNNN